MLILLQKSYYVTRWSILWTTICPQNVLPGGQGAIYLPEILKDENDRLAERSSKRKKQSGEKKSKKVKKAASRFFEDEIDTASVSSQPSSSASSHYGTFGSRDSAEVPILDHASWSVFSFYLTQVFKHLVTTGVNLITELRRKDAVLFALTCLQPTLRFKRT